MWRYGDVRCYGTDYNANCFPLQITEYVGDVDAVVLAIGVVYEYYNGYK